MKKLVVLAVAIVMSGVCFAEDAALDKKIKITEEMLASMDMQKNMNRSFDMVKQMQMNIVKKFSKGKDSEKAIEIQSAVMELMKKELSWDAIKNDIIKVYAETFSEEELQAIADFYKTPVGQKLIQKQPEVQQQMMMIIQKKVMEVMPKVQALTQQMAKESAARETPAPGAAGSTCPLSKDVKTLCVTGKEDKKAEDGKAAAAPAPAPAEVKNDAKK